MSTVIKITKTQISKIIQSSGSFGSWLGNLGKKTQTRIVISLSNAINKFERKIIRKGAARAEEGFS